MSRCAPTRELTAAEHAAELRAALDRSLARIERGDGVVSCTGLDSPTEAALYLFELYRDPADLAAAHAANERQVRTAAR